MFVPRVIFALLICISSAHSITPREEMEADRKQMEAAIAEKHCPDVLKYKTSPDFKTMCPESCTGLHDTALDSCLKKHWACFTSYKTILTTVDNYTKFLNSTCTEAAKNAKAAREAAEARARAKQIDESNAKRDLR